jgi:hypothetical protein
MPGETEFAHPTGLLAAIAPIVGTPRIVTAAGNIVRALGIAIDLAELETNEAPKV